MSRPTLRQRLGIELVEVSLTEKVVASVGVGLSILLLMMLSTWVLPMNGAVAVVASMGASAVLLFGVPHGQLSQPWPVVGGHSISAIAGVLCAHSISRPMLAAECAVGLAIGAMH